MWKWFTVAALAMLTLDFAIQECVYDAAAINSQSLMFGLLGVAVLCVLAVASIRASAVVAALGGPVAPQTIGGGISVGVRVCVAAFLGTVFVVVPILTSIGKSAGGHGTTTQPVAHETAGIALITVWGAVLLAPWFEEVAMRGFLLAGLSSRFGFWPAAIVSSAVWAGWHGVTSVLLPFTALGITLCWMRRRSGTLRTGIALHGTLNAFIYSSQAHWMVVPPLVLVALSLVVTRGDASSRIALIARAAWSRAGAGLEQIDIPLPASPAVWVAAGVAILITTAVGYSSLLGRPVDLTEGHIVMVTQVVSLGLLALALPGMRRAWQAPAAFTLAGFAGALLAGGSLAILYLFGYGHVVIVSVGYVLLSIGLLGLAGSTLQAMARTAAVLGGLLIAATFAPLPYLVTSYHSNEVQAALVLLGAGIAFIVVGLATPRTREEPFTPLVPQPEPG